MNFGERIKYLRTENQLTRDELSRELNITYAALAKYEINSRFPDRNTLFKMADYFDVSLDYLLCRTDDKDSNSEYNSVELDFLQIFRNLTNDENKNKVKEYMMLLKLSEEK